VAAGADGLLVEVHPNPDKAWSDGEQSLTFEEFDGMMGELAPWWRAASCSQLRDGDGGMRRLAAVASAVCGIWLAALVYGLPPQQARRDGRAVQKQIETVPVIFTAAPVYASLAALHGEGALSAGCAG